MTISSFLKKIAFYDLKCFKLSFYYVTLLCNIIFPVYRLQYPIVQRVSKTIFVVKCAVIEKFPLGFLHCSVVETRNKAGNVERKFLCPCRKIKQNNSTEGANKESMCVHFYACILAFISDEKFMNEFSYHIQVILINANQFYSDLFHLARLNQVQKLV